MQLDDTTGTTTSETATETKPAETAAVETTEAKVDIGEGSLMGDAGAAKDETGTTVEGDGKVAEVAAEPEKKPEHVVPETYELTAPKGFVINDDVKAEAEPVFKELGLSNEQANLLMPLAGRFAERIATQQQDAFQAVASDWAREAQKDPEIGGSKWDETANYVAKALDNFGAPSVKDKDGNETNPFRKLLNDSKLGNHPEMIRMFRKVGERISEDSDFVRADAGAHVKPSREEVLYPSMTKKE